VLSNASPVRRWCSGGRQDALTPVALHEEIAAGIRGAKLVVERSGHLSPLEQPDVVSAALRRWLAE